MDVILHTMTYFEVLGHIFSAFITIFLAFSPGIAQFVTHTPDQRGTATEVAVIPKENPLVPSSLFEAFSEAVRAQLRTDTQYQQATVTGALTATAPLSATSIEAALVNIFCTARRADIVRTITGSGAFIGGGGVILTNAHIAQFLLLTGETGKTTARCVIRQGSPALSRYEAGLLYVSPTWIIQNASQLYVEKPLGTGENDFALLYVTDALDGDMPKTFPTLPPAPLTHFFNQMEVYAAGYPAEILTANDTHASLDPVVAPTSITRLFTFGSGKVDLVSIAASTVGEQGSSGGPIINEDGSIIGLITTRGKSAEEGARSLRALTLSYINRTLLADTGLDLAHTIIGNIPLRAKIFHETIAPYLRALLLDTL